MECLLASCGICLLVGSILLLQTTNEDCGLIFTKYKTLTQNETGIVFNSSINTFDNSNIEYIFNNYVMLLTENNQECILTVYEGYNYDYGKSKLYPINSVISVNYDYLTKKCFLEKQKKNCKTEYNLSVTGVILLGIVATVIAFFLIGSLIVLICSVCRCELYKF